MMDSIKNFGILGLFQPSSSLSLTEVPAVVIEKVHHSALVESGLAVKRRKLHNFSRDAYRAIKRYGIGWRIPKSMYNYMCDDGSYISIYYLRPTSVLEYLVSKQPQVVFGSCGQGALPAFWEAYRMYHPTHEIFQHHANDLARVIPIAVHGDEGRGKRRSNTTVVSLEFVLGIKGPKKPCSVCRPTHLDVCEEEPTDPTHVLARIFFCNLKGHSFLQHVPLFVLPGTYAQSYKDMTFKMLELIGDELRELFFSGFKIKDEQWFVALVGCKGDLKWYSKIAKLTRGYEHKGRKRDVACCHICLAGSPGMPAEDLTSQPVWADTLWRERPWDETEEGTPPLFRVPFDQSKPEALYKHDIMHTLRLGVYRDFVGSTILLYLRWNFFGTVGGVDEKLKAAHGSFRLWLMTTKKTAALRSFSASLFVYKNKKSYPYANVKASDANLLLKWLVTLTIAHLNDGPLDWQLQVLNTILATARLAIGYYQQISSHHMFLTPNCAARAYEQGLSFVNGYIFLAHWAFENKHCLYAIKPKIHFFRHLLMEKKDQLDAGDTLILSPLIYDCCQCEDLIGRVCRLGRRIDGRVLSHRVLENYLIKAALLAQREFSKPH